LREAEEELRAACEAIRPESIQHAFPEHLARLGALASLEVTRELAVESGMWRERMQSENPLAGHLWKNPSFRLLAAGAVYNRTLHVGVVEALASLREWLVGRLEQQQGRTHCGLLCEVDAVPLPAAASEVDTTSANLAVGAGAVLVPAVREVLRSCICDAHIPPCPPCDDTGVLLACITVKDCKVTEICNLGRKFVLSAAHIRHWFPEIGCMGEELETWCCPSCHGEREEKEDEPEPRVYGTPEETVHAAMGHRSAYTRLATSAILEPREARGGPLEFLAPVISGWRAREDAELRSALDGALAEIKRLRVEHAAMQERMARIERKKPEGKQ